MSTPPAKGQPEGDSANRRDIAPGGPPTPPAGPPPSAAQRRRIVGGEAYRQGVVGVAADGRRPAGDGRTAGGAG